MTRRRTFSYPLSLAVVIAALVAGAGGWVAWWNYRAGVANTRDLANTLFAQVGRQTADATAAFLAHAPPAAEALRNLDADAPGAGSEARARQLLDVLRANPGFTWVSYSDAAGAFVGAYRPAPGALRINRSSIANGTTTLDEHDVLPDGSWKVARHADDTRYDPRTRPFYQLAMKSGGAGVWTPPYVFAGQNVPGVTYALPAAGGVFTIDFDLARLSQLVRGLAPSEHGRVAIVAEDGAVLAHPTAALARGDQLVTLGEVDDATLRAVTGGGANDTLATTVDLPLPGAASGRWRIVVYAPDSDFTAALRGRVVSSLLISLAAVVIGVLIAWLLARRISVPLTQLADDMAHVGNFELEDRPETPSVFREIELMNSSLVRMKGGLRSFARYVPRDLVRAVIASGHEATLSGELRELTVFFSDLAGFTTLAESKQPDELVRFLGKYFEDMSRLIAGEGGTVDKYLGDGIMAFWGAPIGMTDHAARACAAALRCHRHLAGSELTTRIGLATGEVLVGNIGSPERINYTVMGDTANLASRLEGLNKQYGTRLMISEATFEAAKESIVARPIDVVAVKGKQRGVRVYELLALASERDADAEALAADSTAALDAYWARDFAGAMAAWSRVLARRPGDQPATIMTERAQELVARPPDERWSAVMIAKDK